MKQIPALDEQYRTDNPIDHSSVIHGYRKSRELGLDLMILHEFGLYRSEVPAIVESLRRHGIEQVALTHACSSIMELMWEFLQAGATCEKATINIGEKDIFGTPRTGPAFIITLN